MPPSSSASARVATRSDPPPTAFGMTAEYGRVLWPKTCTVSPPRKPRMWKGRPSTATGGTRTHSGKGVIDRGTDDTRVFASKVTTRLSEDRDPDPDAEAEAGCLAASPADGVFHP